MTSQYCTFELPLDLSEDELYGSPEGLDIAVSKLDAYGWNTGGYIHSATFQRARSTLSTFFEEILDMALSVNPQITCARIE